VRVLITSMFGCSDLLLINEASLGGPWGCFFVFKYDIVLSGIYGILVLGDEMQIERLFETVYILMQKGNVTAKQLADRLGVTVRTVYRDLDVLSAAGIPVYTSQGKGGGIRLLENFVLDRSLLTGVEQKEMLAALQSLKATQAADTDGVLKKLGVLFKQKDANWVEIDFSNWGPFDRERFLTLKTAVLQKKVVSFEYYNSRGEKTERRAEPLQLWFKDRAWFLKAFCLNRGAPRIFKLSRMKHIALTDIMFERDLSQLEYEPQGGEPFRTVWLKLKFTAGMAYRVWDEFEESCIHENGDGSFTVLTAYPEDEWVYGYILSFGSGVTVLEPGYISEGILSRLKAAMQNYCRQT
jgi:predicted DNA-binding transcriptional regulator YafY